MTVRIQHRMHASPHSLMLRALPSLPLLTDSLPPLFLFQVEAHVLEQGMAAPLSSTDGGVSGDGEASSSHRAGQGDARMPRCQCGLGGFRLYLAVALQVFNG